MRIAFVGKGGSGKTTVSSLFASYIASQGKRVLALDADINQHFAAALGHTGKLRSMGSEIEQIKTYLRGTNPLFTAKAMHKTTPPGNGSNFTTLDDNDWFIKNYTQKIDDVMIAGAGEIPKGNVGVKCYHGLNGAVELILGHIIDKPSDTVIVDMTAGADAFSSSLFAKVDALVLVVEPTLKSLRVYDQFRPNAKEYDVPLLVVANKVQDQQDQQFIENKVGTLAAVIGQSPFVRKREQGLDVNSSVMEESLSKALSDIAAKTSLIERDWDLIEKRSHLLHRKNADDWMGTDAHTHIDPSFSLGSLAKTYDA